jgi:omega-6 fatty acid desaturase (delta-12 desaturase)
MAINYTEHPADLVGSGILQNGPTQVGIKELKSSIPPHCFKPSPTRSLLWLLHDISLAILISVVAGQSIPQVESSILRCALWASYGWIQGLLFTGIWVLGHECGHGAFLPWKAANDGVGFFLHSFLMTPYFAWKSTHRRHHIYANNMKLDHHYVPPRRLEYLQSFGSHVRGLEELTEDAPLVTFLRIVLQQVLGWPWYLINNVTASPQSLSGPQSTKWFGNSHFTPWGSLFRAEEAHLIILSDIGLCAMATLLYSCSLRLGTAMTLQLYIQPYLWLNHWLVAITYLHHTHPKLPKFEPEAWTFIKGATATIDRPIGFIGRHFLHNIADYHVIHHLFSRIPFYHAEEATKAIIPLMGADYHAEQDGRFMQSLWESSV